MMNQDKAFPQLFFGFDVCGVGDDTFAYRADFLTGRRIVMADAFSAERRFDDINFLTDEDRLVRAFGQAHIAICAFIGDQQRHEDSLIVTGRLKAADYNESRTKNKLLIEGES